MNKDIYQEVGERIRKIRKQMGLSQESLAFKAQVHPSFISHIERGTKKASLKTLKILADALGVGMEEIFMPSEQNTYPVQKEDLFIRRVSTLLKDKDEHFKYTAWQIIKQLEKLEKEK
ncbi:MAG: helix-turn-helix domain-containing protein [Candidatus Omnitrophica bacterium]|nr:helix-turn-helix domain-containing protein [Candidatus Omnitrophota bacterium]